MAGTSVTETRVAETKNVLAIDAGQSGIKVRHLADEVSDWVAPAIRTDLPLFPQIADVINTAGGEGFRANAIGIGSTGLTKESGDLVELEAAMRSVGAGLVCLAHDSVTAYLGALGDSPGAVVAVGTGVVTLGVGAARVARVDGWGYLIGDAGSGYAIGRAALDAVMRAHDGRGPETMLTRYAEKEFPDLESAYIDLQSDSGRVRRIAAYARVVAELAEAGDGVSIDILHTAAAELAHSAISALKVVDGLSGSPRVCGIGGGFRSTVLAEAFQVSLRDRFPAVKVTIGESDPVDGAAKLVSVPATSPLHGHILRARL